MKTSFLNVLKIRTFVFALSTSITVLIVLACSDGYEDFYSSKITQEAYIPSKYKLIGYSLNLYNDRWDDVYNPEYDLIALNTSDWEKYLESSLSREEIEQCLFTYTAHEIDSLKKILSKSENNYNQKRDFLSYLRVAKDAEVYGNTNYYWWDETRPDYSKEAINLFPIIERNYQMSSGNAFMAERWWFQMVKNLYFQKDYERAIGYFNEYESQFEKNTFYYRVLGYKAGSLYKLGKYEVANALYAKMLTANHAFLQTAHFSFHPMEETDFMATIDLCETSEEKCTAWMLLGTYHDAVRASSEIYKLNPNHEYLDLLMGRILMIAENKDLEWYDEPPRTVQNQAAVDLYSLMIKENKYAKKSKLQSALGYLYFLNGDTKTANDHVGQAMISADKTDTLFYNQLRIFSVLLNAKDKTKHTKTMYDEFIWLRDATSYNRYYDYDEPVILSTEYVNPVLRVSGPFDYLVSELSNMYRSEGNVARAMCIQPTSNEMVDLPMLYDWRSFLMKDPINDEERFLQKFSCLKLDQIENCIATIHTFNGDLIQARQIMQFSSSGSNTQLMGDPFSYRIRDCHDCDHQEFAECCEPYTKLRMLEEMFMWKDLLVKKPNFLAAIKLGNAYYNLSYNGNCRRFSEVPYPSYGLNHSDEEEDYYYDWYVDMTSFNSEVYMAEDFYKKAFGLATNDEEKALATYLLSKCELVHFYNTDFGSNGSDFVAGEYFPKLKQYEKTEFFDQVLNECGYFKTYYTKK